MLVGLNKKTMVGTVGYHILGNHSLPPVLHPYLQQMSFPDYVVVDELNWGPVAVVQRFQAEEPSFERVVILCAVERSDRKVGDITLFQWKGGLPDEVQIQACMGDAATGVISVENLLIIGEYFRVWKDEVYLVDVEPGPEVAGEQLTTEMEEKIPAILSIVRQLAIGNLTEKMEVKKLFGDKIFEEVNMA